MAAKPDDEVEYVEKSAILYGDHHPSKKTGDRIDLKLLIKGLNDGKKIFVSSCNTVLHSQEKVSELAYV